MSINTNWDIDSYREEHESEDHWQLRQAFMQRWKNDYPEERLVCLARVFANMELLGCRYPPEVMQEVSRLSYDVAKCYRNSRKDKLKRTFVSASDAAEDRAKGVKREGGVVINGPPPSKINFVRQGHTDDGPSSQSYPCSPTRGQNPQSPSVDRSPTRVQPSRIPIQRSPERKKVVPLINTTMEMNDNRETDKNAIETNEYLKEMMSMKCLHLSFFNEKMFQTIYGRLILMIRPWIGKLSNIQASCQACHIPISSSYENGIFSLSINRHVIRASGDSKATAKAIVETMAWNKLRSECISIVVKQQWIAQGDTRVSLQDVSEPRTCEFGTPIESSVAVKMMQMMGWKGGGLGADSQGIEEPIKPNLQLVNRAGLGSMSRDVRHLRLAAEALMKRYVASDTLDVDLVFSSEFSKDERATLHKVACSIGLSSKSYGTEDSSRTPLFIHCEDNVTVKSNFVLPTLFAVAAPSQCMNCGAVELQIRFLVVRKKLDPFSIVRAVIAKGGSTPKYQVFLPEYLKKHIRK